MRRLRPLTGLHLPRISESVSFIALKDSESSRALKGMLMSYSEIESQKKEEKKNASPDPPIERESQGFMVIWILAFLILVSALVLSL